MISENGNGIVVSSQKNLTEISATNARASSSGPKTAYGKFVSSMNAMRHGLRASRAILAPGENPGVFKNFHRNVRRRLKPLGQAEASVVDRLIVIAWKLRRIAAVEQTLLNEQLEEGENPDTVISAGLILNELEKDRSTLIKIQNYEYRMEKMHASLLRQLQRLRELRKTAHREDEITENV